MKVPELLEVPIWKSGPAQLLHVLSMTVFDNVPRYQPDTESDLAKQIHSRSTGKTSQGQCLSGRHCEFFDANDAYQLNHAAAIGLLT